MAERFTGIASSPSFEPGSAARLSDASSGYFTQSFYFKSLLEASLGSKIASFVGLPTEAPFCQIMNYRDFLSRFVCFSCLRAIALLSLVSVFSIWNANAAVFSWPTTPGWTAGQPTINGPSQTVDYSSTGQAISVTIANTGATWNSGFPQVAANGSGYVNGGTTANGLIIQPGAETSNATHIAVTVNFNNPGGVTNVQFQLWDIDATVDSSGNGFVDRVSQIQAVAVGGGTTYATASNAHTSNPATVYNTISGAGATLALTGDTTTNGATNNTDQGTVTISFASAITSFSFWYSNAATGSLSQQTMGLGPISYAMLPEISPAWPVALLCLLAVAAEGYRRRRAA